MTFASAPQARERIAALIVETHPRVVILDCSAIPDFEYTALRSFAQAEEGLTEAGITLWLSALNPEALDVVRRSPLGQAVGSQRMFFNLRDAVKAYENDSRGSRALIDPRVAAGEPDAGAGGRPHQRQPPTRIN